MNQDFPLPFRLHSAPLAWAEGAPPGLGLAMVVSEARGAERLPFVLRLVGRNAQPWLREDAVRVAPGNSLLAVGARGELMALDLRGGTRTLRDGREAAGAAMPAQLALLAVAPQPLPGNRWLLLSRDFRPYSESTNALSLLDGGRLVATWPLSGIPETLPPVVSPDGQRAWVMLRSGQVDAFDLARAQRDAGFRTTALAQRPEGGYRLALEPGGGRLLIAHGADHLVRLDARSGAAQPVVYPGLKRRVDAVAGQGAGPVLAWDGLAGELLALNAQGVPSATAPLGRLGDGAAPWLVQQGDDVAVVGVPTADAAAGVHTLFEQHATPAERKDVEDTVVEEAAAERALMAPGTTLEQARAMLRTQLERGWLEKRFGLARLGEMLRGGGPATRVQVVRGLAGGSPKVVVEDRIEGFTPATGFSQCEHVLPVFWTDPRAGAPRQLLVGANAQAPGEVQARVRAYALPA